MQTGQAAENETGETDTELPDLEFLEFLGQFETDEGQWIDPGSLMATEFEGFLNVIQSDSAIGADSTSNNDDQ